MDISIKDNKGLEAAGQFDVYRWSNYPAFKVITDALFKEVVAYRRAINPKARIRDEDKIKRHLRVLLLNLFVASQIGNTWIGISKNKSDYQKESRYRKIFLNYGFLIPMLNNLLELGYLEQRLGFKDWSTGKGFRTRIRATTKLLQRIYEPEFALQQAEKQVGLANLVTCNPEAERETIILRDANKQNVDYEDTDITRRMRENLLWINARLLDTRITLRITNERFVALEEQLKSSSADEREHVDFTQRTLVRVFNGDFEHGGRFYGGWWIGLPKEYRKNIEINHKSTVEVDFSAHHIRMLYAKDGLVPPDDPYAIENCPFPRESLKQVFLVLINANGKEATIKACLNHGIQEVIGILKILEEHHQPIAHYFYSGMGLKLQYEDSMLAEKIMLRMLSKSGATVLPVHDSYIVRNSYEQELKDTMEEAFREQYGIPAKMKTKQTVLDKTENHQEDEENQTLNFVDFDLKEIDRYSRYYQLWGMGQ